MYCHPRDCVRVVEASTPFWKFQINISPNYRSSAYIKLTQTPTPDVINITLASISKLRYMTLSTAMYTKIPVTTHIRSTDVNAPITSARYQPKCIFFVEGRLAIHSENSDIIKLAKSVSKWAASEAIAKLFDR